MIRRVMLNTGDFMPVLGLGTYLLTGNVGKETIDKALFLGYRCIDTALSYGNESDVGEVIRDRNQQGKLRNKDLFVITKVPSVYLSFRDVGYSIQQSLENLQRKYLDLVLIHHPWGLVNMGDGILKPLDEQGNLKFQQYDLVETWKGLEKAQYEGKTKAIGLSNFTISQMKNILKVCKIIPANLQLECHAYLQQRNIKKFCEQRGITLTAYSPLGAPGRPKQHRLPNHKELLKDPVIEDLSVKYKTTKGNVLLRWLLQRDICVVCKASSYSRLQENFNIPDFEISSSDMEQIRNLDCGVKYFHFSYYKGHPDFKEGEEF